MRRERLHGRKCRFVKKRKRIQLSNHVRQMLDEDKNVMDKFCVVLDEEEKVTWKKMQNSIKKKGIQLSNHGRLILEVDKNVVITFCVVFREEKIKREKMLIKIEKGRKFSSQIMLDRYLAR